MDFLQNIDSTTWFWLIAAFSLCCGVLIVVGFALQMIGNVFELFSGVFELVFGIFGGGPINGCGCIVILFGCGICGVFGFGVYNIVQTCGTPQAVNFCRLLGY